MATNDLYPLWHSGTQRPEPHDMLRPDGARDYLVHDGGSDRFHFLHDACIALHGGKLHAAWYNCPDGEIVGESVIRMRTSVDGGETWSAPEIVASDESGEGVHYVPPQLHAETASGDALYCFVGVMTSHDQIVRCDLRVRDDASGTWRTVAEVAGAFLPNCAPVRMTNGRYVLAGRIANEPGGKPLTPCVLLSDRIEGPWEPVRLPIGDLHLPYPETTVVAEPDLLTALVRSDGETALFFESSDCGATWTGPIPHNFPIGAAKMYAGVLSTGQRYLLANMNSEGYRELLTVSVSRPWETAFSRMWAIRNGRDFPRADIGPEWSYPSAIEHDGTLWVVYTSGKRNCVMTAIPVKSLAVE